jgi:hypothetical protein
VSAIEAERLGMPFLLYTDGGGNEQVRSPERWGYGEPIVSA